MKQMLSNEQMLLSLHFGSRYQLYFEISEIPSVFFSTGGRVGGGGGGVVIQWFEAIPYFDKTSTLETYLLLDLNLKNSVKNAD